MIQGDLRLERQGNALIVHSSHNARWSGALVGGLGLIFLVQWIGVTFDLHSHRVVHHLSIARGWYERRRTYAFTETSVRFGWRTVSS